VTLTNGAAIVTWNSVPTLTYQLQSKDDLLADTWNDVGPTVLTLTSVGTATDNSLNPNQRFYRVVLLP
jgi:hypothetical protein